MTRLRVSALLALAIGTTHGAAPAGPPFLPKICLRELQPPTLVRLPPITP
jgi:fructose/tagatose bisphosphate aldolase